MTIGQRIAQKRREESLSQEALGEALGVSRQAIYKWESDAALPELSKLIALSKRFGVTVGWLLGVEEAPGGAGASSDAPPDAECGAERAADGTDGELTERQLRMVQEIVDRYLSAQPKAPRSPWGKWDVRLLFALCGMLLAVIFGVNSRVKTLQNNYVSLQSSVFGIRDSLSSSVYSLSDRVEEILKTQNSLTADYGTEILSADYSGNQITFQVYAVPKTYMAGMRAEFYADAGSGLIPGGETAQEGEKFSAQVTCALTDAINVSAVFVYPDGSRQTQLLESYTGLYSDSMPYVDLMDYQALDYERDADGQFPFTQCYLSARQEPGFSGGAIPATKAETIQVGLFKNQKLVVWAEEIPQPDSFQGDYPEGTRFFLLPDTKLTVAEGDAVEYAALVTDEYGRQTLCGWMPKLVLDGEGTGLTWLDGSSLDGDLSHWDFTPGGA